MSSILVRAKCYRNRLSITTSDSPPGFCMSDGDQSSRSTASRCSRLVNRLPFFEQRLQPRAEIRLSLDRPPKRPGRCHKYFLSN